MQDRISVSSADFIRNIGHWQSEALRNPISITHHGRERLVLAAPAALRLAAVGATDAAPDLARLRADVAAVRENLDDGFLTFDSELRVRCSNTAAEAFAGLSREDLQGASILTALPQPFATVLSERVGRVMRTRQSERFEVGVSDGRQLAVTVFPVSVGASVWLRNVTEQHRLRQRLEEGEALRSALRLHARAAALMLDAHALVKSADETYAGWTGFDVAELVGHRFIDLVAANQQQEAADVIDRVLREGRGRAINLALLGKRGEEIEGSLSLAPILGGAAAHGACALFVPLASVMPSQQAA